MPRLFESSVLFWYLAQAQSYLEEDVLLHAHIRSWDSTVASAPSTDWTFHPSRSGVPFEQDQGSGNRDTDIWCFSPQCQSFRTSYWPLLTCFHTSSHHERELWPPMQCWVQMQCQHRSSGVPQSLLEQGPHCIFSRTLELLVLGRFPCFTFSAHALLFVGVMLFDNYFSIQTYRYFKDLHFWPGLYELSACLG